MAPVALSLEPDYVSGGSFGAVVAGILRSREFPARDAGVVGQRTRAGGCLGEYFAGDGGGVADQLEAFAAGGRARRRKETS